MSSLAIIAKNTLQGVERRSPAILTGFAVAGVISTVALTVKATQRSTRQLDSLSEVRTAEDAPDFKEKIRITWRNYIPVVLTGASTIACVIGAQSINARRQAALVGAFTITENAFQEYRDQVIDSLGKGKDKKIQDEMVQKQVLENPPPDDLILLGAGNVLCFDTYTGRYFESTMEKIRKAQNDFNEVLIGGAMYMSLNELYHYLGLPDTVVGEQVGFSPENLLELRFSSVLTEDGRPSLAFSFRALPRQDYTDTFQ